MRIVTPTPKGRHNLIFQMKKHPTLADLKIEQKACALNAIRRLNEAALRAEADFDAIALGQIARLKARWHRVLWELLAQQMEGGFGHLSFGQSPTHSPLSFGQPWLLCSLMRAFWAAFGGFGFLSP